MNLAPRILRTFSLPLARHATYSTLPSEAVVFMDDQMVVCWHPEKKFPYEYTLPLPAEKKADNSVLKIGDKEVSEIFRKKKKEFVVQELAQMTYTTKHRWYPRSRDKKAKDTPPDRPYL